MRWDASPLVIHFCAFWLFSSSVRTFLVSGPSSFTRKFGIIRFFLRFLVVAKKKDF